MEMIFLEPELVGDTLKRIREDKSDICLFDARLYYEKSGNFIDAGHMLKKEYVPQKIRLKAKAFLIFSISVQAVHGLNYIGKIL